MIQRHFVVTDDAIVEVGHVKRTVRSQLKVHGPEPGILADEEIRLLDRPGSRTRPLDAVVIDP